MTPVDLCPAKDLKKRGNSSGDTRTRSNFQRSRSASDVFLDQESDSLRNKKVCRKDSSVLFLFVLIFAFSC